MVKHVVVEPGSGHQDAVMDANSLLWNSVAAAQNDSGSSTSVEVTVKPDTVSTFPPAAATPSLFRAQSFSADANIQSAFLDGADDPIIEATMHYLQHVKAPQYDAINRKATEISHKPEHEPVGIQTNHACRSKPDMKYIDDGDVDLYSPDILARREALTQSPKLTCAVDDIWDIVKLSLPTNCSRMFKRFLETKANATAARQRSGLPGTAPVTGPFELPAQLQHVVNAEAVLWSEGVVSRKIYDLIHRRFLSVLAPLGTPHLQAEVRAVIDADWKADVGISDPVAPVLPAGVLIDPNTGTLPSTQAVLSGQADEDVPEGFAFGDSMRSAADRDTGDMQSKQGGVIGGDNDNGGALWAEYVDWMDETIKVGATDPSEKKKKDPNKPKPGSVRPSSRPSKDVPPTPPVTGSPRNRASSPSVAAPASTPAIVLPVESLMKPSRKPVSKSAAKLMMMNKRMFFASMFSITDIWTASVSESEYTRFLRYLQSSLQPAADWKPAADVVDEDLNQLMTLTDECDVVLRLRQYNERKRAEEVAAKLAARIAAAEMAAADAENSSFRIEDPGKALPSGRKPSIAVDGGTTARTARRPSVTDTRSPQPRAGRSVRASDTTAKPAAETARAPAKPAPEPKPATSKTSRRAEKLTAEEKAARKNAFGTPALPDELPYYFAFAVDDDDDLLQSARSSRMTNLTARSRQDGKATARSSADGGDSSRLRKDGVEGASPAEVQQPVASSSRRSVPSRKRSAHKASSTSPDRSVDATIPEVAPDLPKRKLVSKKQSQPKRRSSQSSEQKPSADVRARAATIRPKRSGSDPALLGGKAKTTSTGTVHTVSTARARHSTSGVGNKTLDETAPSRTRQRRNSMPAIAEGVGQHLSINVEQDYTLPQEEARHSSNAADLPSPTPDLLSVERAKRASNTVVTASQFGTATGFPGMKGPRLAYTMHVRSPDHAESSLSEGTTFDRTPSSTPAHRSYSAMGKVNAAAKAVPVLDFSAVTATATPRSKSSLASYPPPKMVESARFQAGSPARQASASPPHRQFFQAEHGRTPSPSLGRVGIYGSVPVGEWEGSSAFQGGNDAALSMIESQPRFDFEGSQSHEDLPSIRTSWHGAMPLIRLGTTTPDELAGQDAQRWRGSRSGSRSGAASPDETMQRGRRPPSARASIHADAIPSLAQDTVARSFAALRPSDAEGSGHTTNPAVNVYASTPGDAEAAARRKRPNARRSSAPDLLQFAPPVFRASRSASIAEQKVSVQEAQALAAGVPATAPQRHGKLFFSHGKGLQLMYEAGIRGRPRLLRFLTAEDASVPATTSFNVFAVSVRGKGPVRSQKAVPPQQLELDLPQVLRGLDPLFGRGTHDASRAELLEASMLAQAPSAGYLHERMGVPVTTAIPSMQQLQSNNRSPRIIRTAPQAPSRGISPLHYSPRMATDEGQAFDASMTRNSMILHATDFLREASFLSSHVAEATRMSTAVKHAHGQALIEASLNASMNDAVHGPTSQVIGAGYHVGEVRSGRAESPRPFRGLYVSDLRVSINAQRGGRLGKNGKGWDLDDVLPPWITAEALGDAIQARLSAPSISNNATRGSSLLVDGKIARATYFRIDSRTGKLVTAPGEILSLHQGQPTPPPHASPNRRPQTQPAGSRPFAAGSRMFFQPSALPGVHTSRDYSHEALSAPQAPAAKPVSAAGRRPVKAGVLRSAQPSPAPTTSALSVTSKQQEALELLQQVAAAPYQPARPLLEVATDPILTPENVLTSKLPLHLRKEVISRTSGMASLPKTQYLKLLRHEVEYTRGQEQRKQALHAFEVRAQMLAAPPVKEAPHPEIVAASVRPSTQQAYNKEEAIRKASKGPELKLNIVFSSKATDINASLNVVSLQRPGTAPAKPVRPSENKSIKLALHDSPREQRLTRAMDATMLGTGVLQQAFSSLMPAMMRPRPPTAASAGDEDAAVVPGEDTLNAIVGAVPVAPIDGGLLPFDSFRAASRMHPTPSPDFSLLVSNSQSARRPTPGAEQGRLRTAGPMFPSTPQSARASGSLHHGRLIAGPTSKLYSTMANEEPLIGFVGGHSLLPHVSSSEPLDDGNSVTSFAMNPATASVVEAPALAPTEVPVVFLA